MEQMRPGLALAFLFTAALAGASNPGLDSAFQEAVDAHQIQENAVLLILRLAGVVWIAVEWVAAIVLAIGFHQLRRLAAQKGLSP